MHLCPGNWVAIGHTVVYYPQAVNGLVQELNVGTVLQREGYLISFFQYCLFSNY